MSKLGAKAREAAREISCSQGPQCPDPLCAEQVEIITAAIVEVAREHAQPLVNAIRSYLHEDSWISGNEPGTGELEDALEEHDKVIRAAEEGE